MQVRKNVLTAFNAAEKTKLAHYHDMFEGVYDELPEKLKRQRNDLDKHLKEYKVSATHNHIDWYR